MKLPELRISSNDPTLAHAVAYGQIKQLRKETEEVFDRIYALKGKTSVRDGMKLLNAHFGKLVLAADILRATGSRPKAQWLVLDACVDGGSDMVAILVSVDKQGWNVRDLRLRLTSHLVARLMQRTTKTSNLQRFAEVLRYHIFAILPAVPHVPEGHSLTTTSGSGALIWLPHDGGVRGVTWLGVESITDATLAKLCKDAGHNKVALHLAKNGEPAWEKKYAEIVDGISLMRKQSSA